MEVSGYDSASSFAEEISSDCSDLSQMELNMSIDQNNIFPHVMVKLLRQASKSVNIGSTENLENPKGKTLSANADQMPRN